MRAMLAFNVTQHDALWVLIILGILCALVWRGMSLLDTLDDLSTALEIKRRDKADTGHRLSIEQLITDQGLDPRDFSCGVEV